MERQTKEDKQRNFRKLGEGYIKLWEQREAHFFEIPQTLVEIAGLTIRVKPEVGMTYPGNNLALKMWLNANRPKAMFRQAIQYITEQGRHQEWRRDWQAALWDVRREDILPAVRIPNDFIAAIEAQSQAFQYLWEREQAPTEDGA